MFRSVSVPRTRSRRPGPLAAGLLLLLALAGAPPAHANLNITTPITVGNGETLIIADGDSVNTGSNGFDPAVTVNSGGTLKVTGGSVLGNVGVLVAGGAVVISGGSISGDNFMKITGGTVTISGGSFSSGHEGVYVDGGTLTISGGSFSSGAQGNPAVVANGGTANIFGCGLQFDPFVGLTGTLQDGTPIAVPTSRLTDSNLHNLTFTFAHCPPAGTTALATCTASGVGANVSFSPLLVTGTCGGTPTVSYDHQPGSFFPLGNTTVNATAMDASGSSITCPFTVTVAYGWTGLQQPINADGSSVFKAGSTVPVMFQLTGPSACITNLPATLGYAKLSDGVAGGVNEAVTTSTATTGNQFRYLNGQYLYNWSTKGLAPGTYLLRIDLGDGVPHTVTVGLR